MKGVWLLPFQLHLKQTALAKLNPDDTVILIEDFDFYRMHPFHKKRIAALMSAVRHHALTLKDLGFNVRFETGNTSDVLKNVPGCDALRVVQPTDYDVWQWQKKHIEASGLPYQVFPDAQFILPENEIKARLKAPYKMDPFYRVMRKDFKILMDGDKPTGGALSFDKDNRKKLPKDLTIDPPLTFPPDAITRDVLRLVETTFHDHPGSTEGFHLPVTHGDAKRLADHFFTVRLATFGPYQDALTKRLKDVSHSMLSQAMNTGLIDPLDLVKEAEMQYHAGAPINSVEGFIRQILGWREYIRGVYLLEMPGYADHNHYGHTTNLPHYYWDGQTAMTCLKESTTHVIDDGYAHHIQRLMVLGNFANLAGVDPKKVNAWFLEMFIDSHDWVTTPNVIGMALHADGGLMATKPYISSGAYIHKMGDYCDACFYDVKKKVGPDACPFNALYWNYIDRHYDILKANPRMGIPLSVFKKMTPSVVEELRERASQILDSLETL